MRGRHREGKQRRGQAHPLPEHPSEEGSGRLDLLVGFGHQLHGLLLFAGVVHREPGLPLAERREENRPMFRSGRRGARRGEEMRETSLLLVMLRGSSSTARRGRSFQRLCRRLLDREGMATAEKKMPRVCLKIKAPPPPIVIIWSPLK